VTTTLAGPQEAGEPTSMRAKYALVKEILTTYRRARGLLRREQLAATVDELTAGRPERPRDPRDRVIALRLERAVTHTLKLPGADSRCLMHALVLQSLLARRGIESTLAVGAREAPKFAAHAWVEHEGTPLQSDAGYETLVRLPRKATVSPTVD
jgi:hypothetical protein